MKAAELKSFLKNNGLTVAFFTLFILSMVGQFYFGLAQYNNERAEEGAKAVEASEYATSGHFIQATFENWESEFLQMALFVVLTIFLQQKGSSESKDFSKKEPVDREPSARRKDAPWPVKAGGWILSFYKHSLTIVLLTLFVTSFGMHFYGSLKDENLSRLLKGQTAESAFEYIGAARFWFESFQNWQSEFLSVLALVVFSIFLRQKGSPQSKPVDASVWETGE